LEDSTAGGSEGGVPCRGVVPASGLYCDQPGDAQPSGRAVLQQARDSGTMDQRRQAGGEDDPPLLSSFSLEPGAARAEPTGLQSGQPVATAGSAEEDRELVADKFATTSGEDRRTAGETCALLLASFGRRTSDAAAVRGDAGSYRVAADWDGIERRAAAKSVNWVVKEEVLHKWAGCGVTSPANRADHRRLGGAQMESQFKIFLWRRNRCTMTAVFGAKRKSRIESSSSTSNITFEQVWLVD